MDSDKKSVLDIAKQFGKDFILTIRPMWDFRMWVLLGLAVYSTLDDSALKGSVVQHLSIMLWIATVSHIIRVIITTNNGQGEWTKKATETPLGCAMLLCADRFILAVILFCTTFWLK